MEELLAQLLQQRALQVKAESDAKHGPVLAQLRAGNDMAARQVTRLHPQDRMPVYLGDDQLLQAQQAGDIAALRERGLPIPDYMYNGLSGPDVTEAHRIGADMNAMGGDPMLKSQLQPFKDPQVVMKADPAGTDFVAGREVSGAGPSQMDKRMKGARVVDQYVQLHGYDPGLFDGLNQDEAARRIIDQLQAQRERSGDIGAWAALNQY